MHVNVSDNYVARRSRLHRLDPRVKVLVAMLFIVSNVLLPDAAWLAFLAGWIALLAGNLLADVGLGYTFKRSFVALPFALAAVSVLFALPGQPAFALSLGPWRLVATDAGVLRFLSIVVRSWLSVQAAILLTATTEFPDVLHALRHLRVPNLLVTIISLMYRYLFVLSDEALRLLRARESRSARPPRGRGGGSIAWRARVAGNMAGQLFLRSYERSDRVYSAMLARGYAGQLLTINPHVMHRGDWLALGIAFAALVLIQVVGRLRLA